MPQFSITYGNSLYEVVRVFHLITIGRAPTNDIVLPDLHVSRYHAALVRASETGKSYFIRDLSSRQGTRVNGANVCQQLVNEGDRIEIGPYLLKYSEEPVIRAGLIEVVPWAEEDTGEKSTLLESDQERIKKLQFTGRRREVIEELLKRASTGATLRDLLEWLVDPILQVLEGDRGFVGLFETRGGGAYEWLGVRGFEAEKGERIQISDPTYLERLLKGQPVQEHTTLLVPFRSRQRVSGFFCVARKHQAPPFVTEDIDFLDVLGQQGTDRTQAPNSGRKGTQTVIDEVIEWPMRLIWASERMKGVARQIEHAAATDVMVLLLGETGTGKGLVARTIHDRSSRRKGPFVDVDLTNIPPTLAESELLGYEPGAHSKAEKLRKGRFELAHSGTIFLDEIGVLKAEVQDKLRKPIDEKIITRLGSERSISVDVRVIAATSLDLKKAIDKGDFALDLYRRLASQIVIDIPPLRDRREDIPLLAHYYLDKYSKGYGRRTRWISRTAMQGLLGYNWPGNVGELQDRVKALVSAGKEVLFSWDLPPEIQQAGLKESETKKQPKTMAQVEKEHIMEVLEFTRGNKTQACKILEVVRMTLLNKMDEYGIPRNYGEPQEESHSEDEQLEVKP